MADFYPVLARAVSGLSAHDSQGRRDLYARARAILGEQLRQSGRGGAVDVLREQAALEAAIGRIEAETRAPRRAANGKPVAPAGKETAIAIPERRADSTARSLSKILQAVQSDDADDRPAAIKSPGVTPADAWNATKAPSSLGRAPSSLGTMLFDLTYVVAALAFTAVTYIRCIVWVYQGIIGYPALLGVMAFTLALFIAPPVIIFRRTSRLPSIDSVWRLIHATSRRVL